MRPRQNLRFVMNLIQTHHKTMQLSTPLCKKNDNENLIEASKVAWFCAEFESSSSQIEVS